MSLVEFDTPAFLQRHASNPSMTALMQDRFLRLTEWSTNAVMPSGATHSFRSSQKRRILAEIRDLAALEPGWDGESAEEISSVAIEVASSLIALLEPPIDLPDFSPNPHGTLSLYWEMPHGVVELEIGNTRFSWAVIRDSRAMSTCSGENRAFMSDHAWSDLIAALNPPIRPVSQDLSLTKLFIKWNDEFGV